MLLAAPALVLGQTSEDRLGLPPQDVERRAASESDAAKLGARLFVDANLSADGKVSCARCHAPDRAFSDGRARPLGHRDQPGTRNAPSLFNVAYQSSLFWDGRSASLESQALAPLTNPAEHALQDDDAVLVLLKKDARYAREFSGVFHVSANEISIDMVAAALAAYERTLVAAGSPFDRFLFGHVPEAMNAEAIRGLELFRGRAQCASCHTIQSSFALLSDGGFHASPIALPAAVSKDLVSLARRVRDATATGNRRLLEQLIASDSNVAALGRFVVTLNPSDIGKFKTPSLRNVALTAPYMHDGSVPTLEEAVDLELYGRGTIVNYPIILTAEERGDLLEFLRALTSRAAAR